MMDGWMDGFTGKRMCWWIMAGWLADWINGWTRGWTDSGEGNESCIRNYLGDLR